jgi:hypothetical protein
MPGYIYNIYFIVYVKGSQMAHIKKKVTSTIRMTLNFVMCATTKLLTHQNTTHRIVARQNVVP